MKYYRLDCTKDIYPNYKVGEVYREDSKGINSERTVAFWVANNDSSHWTMIAETKFKVDQKIICVDPTGYLADRQVYTVKSIELDSLGNVGINVAECDNKIGFTSGYNQDRFRPFNVTFDLDYNDMMTLDVLLDLASEMNVIPDDFEKLEAKIGNQLLNQM